MLQAAKGNIVLKPDAKHVNDGYNEKKLHTTGGYGAHAELWHQIGKQLKARGEPMDIIKTRAHIDEEEALQLDPAELRDYVGNDYVDALAAWGALLDTPDMNDLQTVRNIRSRATLIARRLVAANAFYLDNMDPEQKGQAYDRPKVQKFTPLQHQVEHTKHQLNVQDIKHKADLAGMAWCLKCRQMSATKGMEKLLATRCYAHVPLGGDQVLRPTTLEPPALKESVMAP